MTQMSTDMPRDVYRDVGMPRVCVFTETHGQEMHTDSRDTCHGHVYSDIQPALRDTWEV